MSQLMGRLSGDVDFSGFYSQNSRSKSTSLTSHSTFCDAVLALAGLDVQSHGSGSTDHLTDPYSLGQQPIHFPQAALGQGDFGKVFLVSHLSNGMVYAAKELLKGLSLRNEAAILRNISHLTPLQKHVVQYVDFTEESTAQLIMESLSLGNLDDQHKKKNILVLGWGANVHIKLSDFGLSKDIPLLKTNCGTPSYKPPEIFRVYKQCKSEKDPQKRASLLYDNKVDVWALGVVVLQHIVDLTDEELPWICSSTDLMTHPFIALLSKMLRMNPSTRPSSENCFQEATRTGMVSPGDLKEDKTSNDDNTSDPITAEVLKPELASPNAPTPIVSGTNRVPGAKRDPSPTGPDQTPADKPNKSNNPTACRADRNGEFVLGHFTSMAPFTSPMELAYQLIIQNSEKEEITSPVDMKTRSKRPASHKSSAPSIR
ncbi:AGC family protein kinase [Histoplasma capsulatum var. duboisii H88]|uniref:Autophagy-related protein 1 n=1 Tax=Ajellomyces capsulatus (strain H88) TaxID=544711 RepID=F0UH67_AJEC8|nr:AGC family protein kinase [Histoplasma capsulatum var. duboisii H88]